MRLVHDGLVGRSGAGHGSAVDSGGLAIDRNAAVSSSGGALVGWDGRAATIDGHAAVDSRGAGVDWDGGAAAIDRHAGVDGSLRAVDGSAGAVGRDGVATVTASGIGSLRVVGGSVVRAAVAAVAAVATSSDSDHIGGDDGLGRSAGTIGVGRTGDGGGRVAVGADLVARVRRDIRSRDNGSWLRKVSDAACGLVLSSVDGLSKVGAVVSRVVVGLDWGRALGESRDGLSRGDWDGHGLGRSAWVVAGRGLAGAVWVAAIDARSNGGGLGGGRGLMAVSCVASLGVSNRANGRGSVGRVASCYTSRHGRVRMVRVAGRIGLDRRAVSTIRNARVSGRIAGVCDRRRVAAVWDAGVARSVGRVLNGRRVASIWDARRSSDR